MNSNIGSFEDWRKFDSSCEEIHQKVKIDLQRKAKTLRSSELTDIKIKVFALRLAQLGKRNLKEEIQNTYKDEAYSDLIVLFLAKVSCSFDSPYELQKDLYAIINETKEPESEE